MKDFIIAFVLMLNIGCIDKPRHTPAYSIECDSIQNFYRGDTLIASIRVKDGQLNGSGTSYIENTGFKSDFFYRNGKLHGDLRLYSKNGLLVQTGQYFMGRKCGKWLDYHENGMLKRLQLFTIDERNCLLAEWDSMGHLIKSDLPLKVLRFGPDSVFIQRERFPEIQIFIKSNNNSVEISDHQDVISFLSSMDTIQGYLMCNGATIPWSRRVLDINKSQDRMEFLWAD